jgi:hypothetical protein
MISRLARWWPLANDSFCMLSLDKHCHAIRESSLDMRRLLYSVSCWGSIQFTVQIWSQTKRTRIVSRIRGGYHSRWLWNLWEWYEISILYTKFIYIRLEFAQMGQPPEVLLWSPALRFHMFFRARRFAVRNLLLRHVNGSMTIVWLISCGADIVSIIPRRSSFEQRSTMCFFQARIRAFRWIGNDVDIPSVVGIYCKYNCVFHAIY